MVILINNNILAIDIGGSNIKIGVVRNDNTVTDRFSIPTVLMDDTAAFYDYLCGHLPDLADISCIGISAPGLIDKEGVVRTYGAPKLHNIFMSNLPGEIAKRTGKPAAAINDGKAAGLCELRLGNMPGASLAVCYIIGTGIAGCVCVGGEILQGTDNFAGEFHFISHLDKPGEIPERSGIECGNIGLVRLYTELLGHDVSAEEIDGRRVADLYRAGDAVATKAFSFWLERISTHIFSIIATLNPEIVCVGGGITERAWFLPELQAAFGRVHDRLITEPRFLTTQIVGCKFISDSNLLGAALYAENKYL